MDMRYSKKCFQGHAGSLIINPANRYTIPVSVACSAFFSICVSTIWTVSFNPVQSYPKPIDPNFHNTAKDAPDRLSEQDVEAWEN